MKKFFHIFLCR